MSIIIFRCFVCRRTTLDYSKACPHCHAFNSLSSINDSKSSRTVLEKACLIVNAILNEIDLGTKHYVNENLTTDTKVILEAMRDGKLIIEPQPGRKNIFEKYAEISKNGI